MKKILGILLILIIAALIIFLLYFKGFGGFGKDSGDNKKGETSVSQTTEKNTEASTEPTTEKKTESETVDITVSGHDYILNNEKVSLEALAAELTKLGKETQINISFDDTAAKNTMDDLTDKLDELGYKNYKKAEK